MELECFKQVHALNTLAWNHEMGPRVQFVGLQLKGDDW